MRRRWATWVETTARTEGGESLALFRIAVGLCVALTVVSAWVWGAAPIVWVDVADGGYRALGDGPFWVRILGGPTRAVVGTLSTVAVVAGACLAAGAGGRLSALVTHQAYYALTSINTHVGGSYETLMVNALFLLVLGDASRTWSADCRWRTGRWSSDAAVRAFPRWLALAQLVIVYASTGLQKVGTAWTPVGGFSALYYTARDLNWARWDLAWLGSAYPLTQLATAGAWAFELAWLAVPLLGWANLSWHGRGRIRAGLARAGRAFFEQTRWRLWVLGLGAALHVGIGVLLEVTTFGWIMLAFYAALFRPEEIRRAAAVIAARATAGRRSRSAA